MDQLYFSRFLGCEHIRYIQKLGVQDSEDGELKVRIAISIEEFEIYYLRRCSIDEVGSRFHRFTPIKSRHVHAEEGGTHYLQKLSILSLCQSILLWSIGA